MKSLRKGAANVFILPHANMPSKSNWADVSEGVTYITRPSWYSCVWNCWQQACVTRLICLGGIFTGDWNLVAIRFRHLKVNCFKCAAENGIKMSSVLGWIKGWFWDVIRQLYTSVGWLLFFGNNEPSMLWRIFKKNYTCR